MKKVILKCRVCQLYDSSPCKPLAAPDLPSLRVVVPPFHSLGTDHVGRLFIKDIYSEKRDLQMLYCTNELYSS